MSTVPYRREAAMCLLACRRYANEHDTTRGVAGTGRSRGHPGAVARPPGRRRVVGVGGPRWLGRRVAVRRRRRPVRAPGRDRRLLRAPATGHPVSLPSGADGTASDAPRYRVVQWATGNIGTYALRAVVEHPRYDLAGAYVYSPAKAGRDAGELCGLDPVGVVATDDIEEIVGLGADCVLYMPAKCDFDEVCRLLESGANIVTTRGEFHRAESLDPAAARLPDDRRVRRPRPAQLPRPVVQRNGLREAAHRLRRAAAVPPPGRARPVPATARRGALAPARRLGRERGGRRGPPHGRDRRRQSGGRQRRRPAADGGGQSMRPAAAAPPGHLVLLHRPRSRVGPPAHRLAGHGRRRRATRHRHALPDTPGADGGPDPGPHGEPGRQRRPGRLRPGPGDPHDPRPPPGDPHARVAPPANWSWPCGPMSRLPS